jgi:3-methyladenine DNA glycosylase AlkD
MDSRTIVWIVYGAFVGWTLRRWYEHEKQNLMWEVTHQAEMAALRAREALPEVPAPVAAEAAAP